MTPEEVAAALAEYEKDPAALMGLCMWREARSESQAARIAVGQVIMNRCKMAPAEGFRFAPSANILKPYAFSSFNSADPQHMKFPAPTDMSYRECYVAAKQVLAGSVPDNSGNAVWYHDNTLAGPPIHTEGPHKGQPVWGPTVMTARIDHLTFYRKAA